MTTLDINALANFFGTIDRGGYPGYGYLGRWQRVRYDIYNSQWLYEADGYAGQIVQNIVEFAAGDGMRIDFGRDRINAQWNNWRWNLTAPLADPLEMEHLAVRSLIRDGDIMGRKRNGETGEAVDFIEPRYIWSSSSTDKYQAGIKVDNEGRPVAYIYQPTTVQRGTIAPQKYEEIPADEVVHAFRLEYAGQARGLSWMRRAIWPLYSLRQFDAIIDRAAELAVMDRGFYTIPMELLEEVSSVSADAEKVQDMSMREAIIRATLNRTDWDDVDKQKRFPQGIEWKEQKVTGITDFNMIEGIRAQLLDRIGASVGLSRQALTDPSARTFPISRIDLMKDIKFYQTVQRYLRSFMLEIIDWWCESRAERDLTFDNMYDGFALQPAPFPYVDALKDAQSLKILASMGVMSPQQIIRDRGESVEQVRDEIRDHAEWMQKLQEDTGFVPTVLQPIDEEFAGEVDKELEADERESEEERLR